MDEEESLVAAAPVVELREIFRRFWPYARPYRRWLPLILLFAALGSALQAATIWMYKILVDEVLVPRDFGLLLWVVLAYLGLTLAEGVAAFCEEYLSEWVGGRFIVSLRNDLFRYLQGLSLSFFGRRKLGDMIARLSDDIEEIEELMISEFASILTSLFQVVFFVGALFYLQWRLALVSLFVIPLFLLAARYFSGKLRGATREERRRSGSISAVAEESLSNAALVQAYNLGERGLPLSPGKRGELRRRYGGHPPRPSVLAPRQRHPGGRYWRGDRRGNLGAVPRPPHDRRLARLPGLSESALQPDPGRKRVAQHVLRGHGRG